MKKSSIHRKLLVVKNILDSFEAMLQNQSVQVNIGNSSTCSILSVGRAKPGVQNIAIDVLRLVQSLN